MDREKLLRLERLMDIEPIDAMQLSGAEVVDVGTAEAPADALDKAADQLLGKEIAEEPTEWSRVPPDKLAPPAEAPRLSRPLVDGTVILVPFEQAAAQIQDLSDIVDENGKLLDYGPGV